MSTAMLNVETTVGQLVAERPGRAKVFQKLGIDFCCGGKRPLKDVCVEHGLDVEQIVGQLADADAARGADEIDWSERSMTELCDHIEATHHAYLRDELPRLSALVAKVAEVHGPNHGELLLVRDVYENMRAELESHMYKEEHILFPAIRRLESRRGEPCFHCGSLQNPIRVMEHEHDSAGEALARLRELTKGYVAPPEACNSYRAMLHGLEAIEADMHQHVHKENNILFPRAVKEEAEQSR